MTPRYEHDCERCIFLGQSGRFDLYFADHGGINYGYEPADATIIARFGDEGSAYNSGIALTKFYPEIGEGLEIALRRGLIKCKLPGHHKECPVLGCTPEDRFCDAPT